MGRFVRRFLAPALLLLMLCSPVPALAAQVSLPSDNVAQPQNVLGGVDCSKAPDSAVCQDKGKTDDPVTGNNGIIIKITRIIAIIAGIAAVIMIIVAGMQFVFSDGDSQETVKARNTIIFALVGIIVIVLAQAIITFIVDRI